MTRKLSGSYVTLSTTLSCAGTKFVTPLLSINLQINSITELTDYSLVPDGITLGATDHLFELTHNYASTNDLTSEPPFDFGDSVTLAGFTTLTTNPTTGIVTAEPASAFTGTLEVFISKASSTIIKLTIADMATFVLPDTLGTLSSSRKYKIKNHAVLTCTPVPTIIPNITLDFETLEIPWEPSTPYTIEVGAGFVKHKFGEEYGNPAFTINYTTNPAPELVGWEPVLKETTGNIETAKLNFIRNVKTKIGSTGTYRLYDSTDTLIHSYNVGDITATGTKSITLPVLTYVSANKHYYLQYDAAVLRDLDNLSNEALTSKTAIQFDTFSPPLYSWLPGLVTSTRNNRSVDLTYRYSIAGNSSSSGTIRFYKADGTLLRTFTPTGSNVSYVATSPSLPGYPNSTTVKFNVYGLLKENEGYYLLVDEGVFKDLDNFTNLAISNTSELAYSTDDILFPGLKGELTSSATSSIIGNRAKFGQATIASTSTMSATAMRVKVSPVTMTASTTVSANMSYKLVLTTANKTYIANTRNGGYFTTSTIRDHDEGATYNITFSTGAGYFGPSTGGVNGYSFTGTYTDAKTFLEGVYLWPGKNFNLSSTYTITVKRNGVTQDTNTRTLTYVSTNYFNHTFPSGSTYTFAPNDIETYYGYKMSYIVVGGGGGGGGKPSGSGAGTNWWGGGGGAGQAQYVLNQLINSSSYTVTVGDGGSAQASGTGDPGGASSFNGLTSLGGDGGTPSTGGASGSGSSAGSSSSNYSGNFAGPYVGTYTVQGFGGGGGQGGAGGSASYFIGTPGYYTDAYGVGGTGGNGVTIAISPYFTDTFSYGGPGGTKYTAQGTTMSTGAGTSSSSKYGSGGKGAQGGQVLSGGNGGAGAGFVDGPDPTNGVQGVVIIITYA